MIEMAKALRYRYMPWDRDDTGHEIEMTQAMGWRWLRPCDGDDTGLGIEMTDHGIEMAKAL